MGCFAVFKAETCLLLILCALQCTAAGKEILSPGFGYPGVIAAYKSSASLKADMSRFRGSDPNGGVWVVGLCEVMA